MYVSVDLLGTSANASSSKEVIYDIDDITTGDYLPPIVETFSPASGGDAEFILEDPLTYVNGSQTHLMLADFGTMAFSSAYYGEQFPDNPLASEYEGGCVGGVYHYALYMATATPVPPGIGLADPEAFTDDYGCDFPIERVNPSETEG